MSFQEHVQIVQILATYRSQIYPVALRVCTNYWWRQSARYTAWVLARWSVTRLGRRQFEDNHRLLEDLNTSGKTMKAKSVEAAPTHYHAGIYKASPWIEQLELISTMKAMRCPSCPPTRHLIDKKLRERGEKFLGGKKCRLSRQQQDYEDIASSADNLQEKHHFLPAELVCLRSIWAIDRGPYWTK